MKNAEVREQFIELRAEGRSYADIAVALNVSKTTLISWGRELAREIANARTLRLDELFEKYLVAKGVRVREFGRRLEAILAELDKRDLADVPTGLLLKLALEYGEKLKAEAEPLLLRGEPTPVGLTDVADLATEPKWPA